MALGSIQSLKGINTWNISLEGKAAVLRAEFSTFMCQLRIFTFSGGIGPQTQRKARDYCIFKSFSEDGIWQTHHCASLPPPKQRISIIPPPISNATMTHRQQHFVQRHGKNLYLLYTVGHRAKPLICQDDPGRLVRAPLIQIWLAKALTPTHAFTNAILKKLYI